VFVLVSGDHDEQAKISVISAFQFLDPQLPNFHRSLVETLALELSKPAILLGFFLLLLLGNELPANRGGFGGAKLLRLLPHRLKTR